jgi:hypothetical protein
MEVSIAQADPILESESAAFDLSNINVEMQEDQQDLTSMWLESQLPGDHEHDGGPPTYSNLLPSPIMTAQDDNSMFWVTQAAELQAMVTGLEVSQRRIEESAQREVQEALTRLEFEAQSARLTLELEYVQQQQINQVSIQQNSMSFERSAANPVARIACASSKFGASL